MTKEEILMAKAAQASMRRSSEMFFGYARWHMLRGVVLDLCRLCDPKETLGKQNLTVERIFDETDFSGRSTIEMLTKRVMNEALDLVRDSTGIKALRHRLLAHFDFDTALRAVPIATVEIDAIDLAVRSIVEFQHRIAICRENRPVGVESAEFGAPASVSIPWKESADHLLRILAAGLNATENPGS